MKRIFQNIGEEVESLLASNEDRFRRTEQAVKDLQIKVSALNTTLERALSDLLPKVESLLRGDASATVSGAASSSPSTSPSCQRTLSSHSQGKPLQRAHTSTQKEPKATTSTSEASSVPYLPWPSVTEAAAEGDEEELRRILANGGDANQRDRGVPALHLATARGHVEAVQALLDGGACLDLRGPGKRIALHIATAKGYVDIVRRLLEAGSKVEVVDAQGNTPLKLAVYGRQWRLARMIADCCVTVFEGKSALMVAAEEGDIEIVQMLLRRTKYENVWEALSYAKNASVVRAFENVYPRVIRREGGKAMRKAAADGRRKSMVALLDEGVDINCTNSLEDTALIAASARGHVECVKELVRRGAHLDAVGVNGFTALHWASDKRQEDVMRVLLDAGADATIKSHSGKTALKYARTEVIRTIIRNHLRS